MIGDSYYDVCTQGRVVQGKNVRLVVLGEIPEDEDLRRQWNGLLERVDDPQVFFTYEWALAVQRAYADSLKPLVVCAYDDQGALCGAVALARNAQNEVSFLCATTGDYCDFLSAPLVRNAFVAAVLAELKQQNLNKLTLTNLPADSPTVAAIRVHAGRVGYHRFQRLAYMCAQYSMKVLDRARDEKPRVARPKMIRRSLKALATEGEVRLDHATSWSAVEPILPDFLLAHVARFLVTGRISNMAHAERRLFLTELARLLSREGWLCLTRMMTGPRTVAWNYGFRFRGTWFWYQPTFDSEVEKHSPGYCLLAKIIEEAAGNPEIQTADLGLGAEEYKDRVANQERRTLCVTLRRSAAGHAREAARYGVAKVVKLSPTIERLVRSGRTGLGHLARRIHETGLPRTIGWMFRRLRTSLLARDEVFFYEVATDHSVSDSFSLCGIDLNLLARAAMFYVDDEATLAYLVRCAKRVHEQSGVGFALMNGNGQPVHFLWAAPFPGFYWSELDGTIEAPSPDSVLLFDAWTPDSQRGHGYYATALALAGERIEQQDRRPWVFSAATNQSSVRGIEKMGFPRRFSIVRRRILRWQWMTRHAVENRVGSEVLAA